MVIEQMSDRECRELLARTNVARLACSRNDQPYVVPIDVDYYDGFLYGFSTLGQKIEWMRANPLVCVEVDELTTRRHWESVIIFGQYEEITDIPEHLNARSDAQSLFQRHPIWWEPATVPLAGHQSRAPVLFRIVVKRMSGRRARPDNDDLGEVSPTTPEKTRSNWLTGVLHALRNRLNR